MTDANPSPRYRVVQPFHSGCLYHYNAPFTGGEQVRIPVGMVLRLHPNPPRGASAFYAWPLPEGGDDPWCEVLAPGQRGSRRFGGYSLIIDDHLLAECCQPAGELAPPHPDTLAAVDAFAGCLLGTAAGDAVGLPLEGLSARRIGRVRRSPLAHSLVGRWGMVSDDTEHACIVAQALARSNGEPERFRQRLAFGLRWWLLGLPAGIGLGTLRALVRLWVGFGPQRSGVGSAGNGPMMRAPLIGVFAGDDAGRLGELVAISTRITHTDPRAERAALIVAWAAHRSATGTVPAPAELPELLRAWTRQDAALAELVDAAALSAAAGESALAFCQSRGMARGVSGFCYSTLQVVLQIWLRRPREFGPAVEEAIRCGGDTDTVAAILGGIIGAGVGVEGIPPAWLGGLHDWPRSVGWMRRLARQVAYTHLVQLPRRPAGLFFPFVLLRNALFMGIVLAHGFRRLLPPY